jgi:hypothetical protein
LSATSLQVSHCYLLIEGRRIEGRRIGRWDRRRGRKDKTNWNSIGKEMEKDITTHTFSALSRVILLPQAGNKA